MCQEERLDGQVGDRHDWNILGTPRWGDTNLALDALVEKPENKD
jgi:hypothetical protein